MNKWPEQAGKASGLSDAAFEDKDFEADLTAENRIQSGDDLSHDPELGADQAFRAALGQIDTPRLPDELRKAVIDRSHGPDRPWAWLAMAAAVILSVIVVTALDPLGQREPSVEITRQDWAQLTLAIETLNTQGQQIARTTQRQISPHLVMPEFEMPALQMRLEPLPYPDSFRRWFQPGVPQPR
jgi:hypothetical protein